MRKTPPASSVTDDGNRLPSLRRPIPLGNDCFQSQEALRPGGRIFGGRLVSEALLAAAATSEPPFVPHSLHAQFLQAGDTSKATGYRVERLRDGRSFCSRCVRVEQDDELNAIVMVSLGQQRQGIDRQAQMPDVLLPDALPDEYSLRRKLAAHDRILGDFFWKREHPVEFRPVDFPATRQDGEARLKVWFRAKPQFLPLDNAVGRSALIAYASDRFVMTSAALPHLSLLSDHDISPASLDHALWMHRDYAPESWLLYDVESVTSANSRNFVRGQIFAENGDHIASVGQEGVLGIRVRTGSPKA